MACHWLVNFNLTLAQLVIPERKWRIVTGDHSTPVLMRGHSWHPVPVLVHASACGADEAPHFHEKAVRGGSLGVLRSRDLIAVLLANAGRLDKFGA